MLVILPDMKYLVFVSVSDNLAYIIDHHSDYNSLRIIDVSNPSNPFQVGIHAPTGVDLWNPFIQGDYVFICNHADDGGELRILNASNPSNIVQITVFDGGGDIYGIYVDGTTIYLADYFKGLIVVNGSNLSNPTKIAQFFDGGHSNDLEVIGNIAYVTDMVNGLEIIEVMI